MTLLYIDGFAHQSVARYTAGSSASWNTNGIANGAPQNYFVLGPTLGRTITPSAEVFTGFRFKQFATSSGSYLFTVWGDSFTTFHLALRQATSGAIELVRGDGTLLATGATVLTTSGWYYIETRMTIADSGGIVQVRLNGSTSNEINFTGDTKNAGTSTNIDTIRLTGNANWAYTDWYIANALGTAPTNTWFGDTIVRSLPPSGDGDLSGLTGSDGNQVSNYQQVDELPPSGTDYNGSATSNAEDTYALTDLPSTSVIVYGVQLSATMAKSDAGAASASPILRLSGTDYTPGAQVLSTSYTEYTALYPTSPATSSAWTATEVNGAQVGMKVS